MVLVRFSAMHLNLGVRKEYFDALRYPRPPVPAICIGGGGNYHWRKWELSFNANRRHDVGSSQRTVPHPVLIKKKLAHGVIIITAGLTL